MAPSRRRGVAKASSAAAAAAARRQWKVGDLVLAKVKGFPSWPATVSEPEKWGYRTDWKKVLVYFFGTKQIAFCNHADVEAFTEEKKKSLLTKRQGKGADFVRAVQEIIDCYDKSKVQERDEEGNSSHEDTVNGGNSEGSGGKSGSKFQVQSPVVVRNSSLEGLCAPSDRPLEVSSATATSDLRGTEKTSEVPVENVSSFDYLKETTVAVGDSLRKKSGDTLQQSFAIQKRTAVRRSRSTTKVDSSRFPSHLMPLTDSNMELGDLVPVVVREESTRRSRRIRKSPGSSVCHETVSPGYSAAFVSNDSSEGNDSEIVIRSSDTVSLNEGSILESSWKTEHPDITVDYLERDVQLSDRLHFQDETVVLKKKRKPNRKRVAHDVTATTSSPTKECGLEVLSSKITPNLSNGCEKVQEQISRTDGDEHLPLVKRARVRMGKPPTEEKQLDLMDTEDKTKHDVLMNNSQPDTSTSPCANNSPSLITLEVKEAVNGSPLPNCSNRTENESPLWKAKNYQLHGSADGEAALPPSKRLHRALEAMSANAVENGEAYIEAQGTPKVISSSGCSGSSEKSLSHISVDDKCRSISDVEDVNSAGDKNASASSEIGCIPSLTSPTAGVGAIISSEVKCFDHLVGCSASPNHDDVNKVLIKTSNVVDIKIAGVSSVSTSLGGDETSLGSPRALSNFDKTQAAHESPQDSLNQISLSENANRHDILGQCKHSTENIPEVEFSHSQEEKAGCEHGATRPSPQRLDSVSVLKETGTFTTPSGSDAIVPVTVANGDSCKVTEECLMSPTEENMNGTCEVVKEVRHEYINKDIDAPSYSSSMKVLIAAAQAKRNLPRATSFSDNVMVDKVFYDAVSSPSLGRALDTYEKASLPISTIFHAPTMENRNHLLHNGRGSPDTLPLHKKAPHVEMDVEGNTGSTLSYRQKSLGRWVNEANAARKSFESMLGTLTRTKESIGRATRLAMDCAKYGIAGEVVEILVRNLESESSLHKRVDLFFLVDSITQCSRGQKGDIGEIYPSAVQSMLPRLLSAAAPPGNAARENRRQCLKVLRLWLERKTLPESIIRHHMRELDSITDASFSSARSRRPSRMERALNDPIREMEGMLVDEYGSNASFHLPGFCMPRMLEDDEGSDADERSFEAVTPEQDPEIPSEREPTPTSAIEKHCHILEDVDGELEMEDVAPPCEVERGYTYDAAGVDTAHTSNCHIQPHIPLPFAPPLPEDHPPSPPPLPTSPPPIPPLLPTLRPPTPSAMCHPFTECADSNLYTGSHNMQNHLQQRITQQPGTPSVKSMMLDTVHNYGPGYRDFAKQTPRPSLSSNGSSCSFPISQLPVQTGNSVQRIDGGSLHNQSCHVQPPPPTLSNQFSYVQADQRRKSWMEASSSSFSKRVQYGHDVHRESRYDGRERMEVSPHEIGERCKIAAPVHSGPVQSDNPDAIYAPRSHYGPPHEPRILNRGWSFPPRAINFRHPTPSRPPECTMSGTIGAPNFWIPR